MQDASRFSLLADYWQYQLLSLSLELFGQKIPLTSRFMNTDTKNGSNK